MKRFEWDPEKSKKLKASRGVGFDEIKEAIDAGGLLDTIPNPNKLKYSHQKILVVVIKEYVFLVPFVENDKEYFLKTLYPSRKVTKEYLKGERKHEN